MSTRASPVWHSLDVPASELRLQVTLANGQCFGWHKIPAPLPLQSLQIAATKRSMSDGAPFATNGVLSTWVGVVGRHAIALSELSNDVLYSRLASLPQPHANTDAVASSTNASTTAVPTDSAVLASSNELQARFPLYPFVGQDILTVTVQPLPSATHNNSNSNASHSQATTNSNVTTASTHAAIAIKSEFDTQAKTDVDADAEAEADAEADAEAEAMLRDFLRLPLSTAHRSRLGEHISGMNSDDGINSAAPAFVVPPLQQLTRDWAAVDPRLRSLLLTTDTTVFTEAPTPGAPTADTNVEQTYREKTTLRGMRLLRQDPWECLASFICSSNNHIGRIGAMLHRLRAAMGRPIGVLTVTLSTTSNSTGGAYDADDDAGDGDADIKLQSQQKVKRAKPASKRGNADNNTADTNSDTASKSVLQWRFTLSPYAVSNSQPLKNYGSESSKLLDSASADNVSSLTLPPTVEQLTVSMVPSYQTKTHPQTEHSNSSNSIEINFPLYEFPPPTVLAAHSHFTPPAHSLSNRATGSSAIANTLSYNTTEALLRVVGYGYRAKFMSQSSVTVSNDLGGARGMRLLRWHDGSLDESQASLTPQSHVSLDGGNLAATVTAIPWYEQSRLPLWFVRRQLQSLSGVGSKVCDCAALFSVDALGLVPIDTHMIQVAVRDYGHAINKWAETLNDKMTSAGNVVSKNNSSSASGRVNSADDSETAIGTTSGKGSKKPKAVSASDVLQQWCARVNASEDARTSAGLSGAPVSVISQAKIEAARCFAEAASSLSPIAPVLVPSSTDGAPQVSASSSNVKAGWQLPSKLEHVAAVAALLLKTDNNMINTNNTDDNAGMVSPSTATHGDEEEPAKNGKTVASKAKVKAVTVVEPSDVAAVLPWLQVMPPFMLALASSHPLTLARFCAESKEHEPSATSASASQHSGTAQSVAVTAEKARLESAVVNVVTALNKARLAMALKLAANYTHTGNSPSDASAGISSSLVGSTLASSSTKRHSALLTLIKSYYNDSPNNASTGTNNHSSQGTGSKGKSSNSSDTNTSDVSTSSVTLTQMTVTAPIYASVNAFFYDLFGPLAGWAHSLLFTSDLPAFKSALDSEANSDSNKTTTATSSSISSAVGPSSKEQQQLQKGSKNVSSSAGSKKPASRSKRAANK